MLIGFLPQYSLWELLSMLCTSAPRVVLGTRRRGITAARRARQVSHGVVGQGRGYQRTFRRVLVLCATSCACRDAYQAHASGWMPRRGISARHRSERQRSWEHSVEVARADACLASSLVVGVRGWQAPMPAKCKHERDALGPDRDGGPATVICGSPCSSRSGCRSC